MCMARQIALIIVMLCGIAGTARAEEVYSMTITNSTELTDETHTTTQFTIGGVTWDGEQTTTGSSYEWSTSDTGLKIGTTNNSKQPKAVTISTSDLAQYSITKVIVSAKTGSSTESTLSVTVGGTAFTCTAIGDETTEETTTPSLSTTETKYTFEYAAGAAGEVVISYDVTKTSGALYFVGVTIYNDGKIYPQLSYSDSYLPVDSVDLAEGTIDYPILTYVNTFTDIASVTYTSSDTSVATVDRDGKVTILGVDGTTTITATYAGSDAFSHDETSYELRYKNESHTFDFNLRTYGIPYVTDNNYATDDITIEGHGMTMSISVSQEGIGYGIDMNITYYGQVLYLYRGTTFTLTTPIGTIMPKISFTGTLLTKMQPDTGTIKSDYDGDEEAHEVVLNWSPDAGSEGESSVSFTPSDYVDIAYIDVTYADVDTGQFVITDAEYATYYADHAYIMPANVEGSTVTSVTADGEMVTSWEYPAGSTVPAKTPLVLHGPENTYTYVITTSDNDAPTENLLYGSLVDVKTYVTNGDADDYYFYELTKGSYGVGFYWAKDDGAPFISEAHKAWLPMAKTVSPAKAITIGKNTTGIDSVTTTPTREGIYTLQGIRCNDMTKKGIYIVDGKKVVKR